MAIAIKDLIKANKEVHAAGGNTHDLVRKFCSAAEDSAEYKSVKATISTTLSTTRKELKQRCEELGLPVARVDIQIPRFRAERSTGRKAAMDEMMDLLMDMEDDTDE